MYKTRLNPPPADGWVPPPELLAAVSAPPEAPPVTASSVGEEEFTLVAPEPPQPKLDLRGTAKPVSMKEILEVGLTAVGPSSDSDEQMWLARSRFEEYQRTGEWRGSLAELKSVLQYECRKWKRFGFDPSGEPAKALVRLYEKLRALEGSEP